MKSFEFRLKGLDCANCANKIYKELSNNSELKDVVVNFNTLKLKYKTDTLTKEDVQEIIHKFKPNVDLIEANNWKEEDKSNREILRLVIGVLIAMAGFFIPMNKALASTLIILGYIILLYKTIKKAGELLIKNHQVDEDFLVSISSMGAYLIGKHQEGLMVIFLYEIGELLEEKAINKTRRSISDLMDIKPEYANIKLDDGIKQVSPEEVNVGDIIVVKQGEKIPLDGVIRFRKSIT